jgi:nucleoside-diphosphate-sugar epimerase
MEWSVCHSSSFAGDYMTKVILLTGATGFVGKQILRALQDYDIEVRLILRQESDFTSDNSVKIDSIIKTPDLFTEPTSWWASVCEGIDSIIHCAWYAEPSHYLQSPKNLDCLKGTLNLAQGAIEARVRRFIGIGTCFEYDLSPGLLSVETALKPITPYAATKAAAFLGLSQCLPAEHLEFAWCRLFYLFGEGEDARRLVPYIHSKLSTGQYAELTSGNQIRDFLDVEEAGRMITEVAMGNKQGAVNICSGSSISVRQLAEQIADKYGRRDLLRFGARPDNLVDPPCVVGVKTKLVL